MTQVGNVADDAHYIVLAESLASGQGYHLINFPDAPPEFFFPPGWPLLLAPIVYLFPDNFFVLRFLPLLFWLGSLLLIYKLFQTRLQSPYLELLLAFVALNPALIIMSSTIVSEAAYLFFSLLTIIAFEALIKFKAQDRWWLFLTVIALALFTMLVRTIGVTLLLSIPVYLLLTRRFRYLGVLVGLALIALGPIIWLDAQNETSLIFSPGYKQHIDYIGPRLIYFAQPWEHLPQLSYTQAFDVIVPMALRSWLSNPVLASLVLLFKVSLISVIILGYLYSSGRYQLSEIYILLYLGIFYLWIVYVSEVRGRFLYPLLPFIYFYLLVGLIKIGQWIKIKEKKQAKNLAIVLATLIITLALIRNYKHWADPEKDRMVSNLIAGNSWLREATSDDTIVMSPWPQRDYLYARRKTVAYPDYDTDLWAYIQDNNVGYIILKANRFKAYSLELPEFEKYRLLPFIKKNSDEFHQVYVNEARNVSIYQVVY